MRYQKIYPACLCYCAALLILAFVLDTPANIWQGLQKIVLLEDTLITDYMELAGLGATFVNSALVLLASLLILRLVEDPLNGNTLVVLGLMGGFSLFGKNIFNMWPFVMGAFLYARLRHEPFVKYSNVALMSTCLSPIVSYVCFYGGWFNFFLGILLGVCIGFVLPPLSAYTFRIQNGMNLYNMGFACGLMAMMVVPVMNSMGKAPSTVLIWSTEYNLTLGIFMAVLCLVFIIVGFFFCGRPPWASWAGYRYLLKATGRAPNEFLRTYGAAPTLINMGVNGLIATGYILLIGGHLNGPTLGGILTIIGFSAYGIILYFAYTFNAVFIGYAIGASPFIAYQFGAQNKKELRHILKRSLCLIAIIGAIMFLLSEFAGPYLSIAFAAGNEELASLASYATRIYSFVFLFCGFSMFGSAFFTALNNGLVSGIIAVVRALVLEMLAIFLLPLLLSVDGIWSASVFAEFGAAIMTAVLLITERKKYGY